LKEFIELLNDHDVRYLVIGGVAVAFHGYPRYTKDLDIWLEINPENAARVIQVLRAFGFESLGLAIDDFLEADTVIQLGYPPNRIDLIMGASGVNFEACYCHKIEVEIEGVKVNFIDLENLKKNKKASGRLQDLADIENLE
jgi:predicted nucleotidyltransferase